MLRDAGADEEAVTPAECAALLAQLQRSLAAVAFIAALQAIFPQPRTCSGLVTCDICGTLEKRHTIENHQQVILDGVRQRLGVKEFEKSEQLLKRVYRAYRSAYVH